MLAFTQYDKGLNNFLVHSTSYVLYKIGVCFVLWACLNPPKPWGPLLSFWHHWKTLNEAMCPFVLWQFSNKWNKKLLNLMWFSHNWVFWKVVSLRALKRFFLILFWMFIGFFNNWVFYKILSLWQPWRHFLESCIHKKLEKVCLRIS
jgi:hypothetical protein